jgi:hypothetical protein
MLKNNKIKKSEIGSEVTIHRRQKSKGLTNLPNTLDQTPKPVLRLRENPGEAINKFIVDLRNFLSKNL